MVELIGPGVTGIAVGDEVFGQTVAGAWAEWALLPAELTARRPPSVSFEDAATLPIAAATAHDALVQLALPAGATLLIIGVGGGVGVAAAQIARIQGLTVIGTASAGKKDFVESLDVVPVEYGEGVADRVRAAAPQGVDGILDLVGGHALEEEVAGLLSDRTKLVSAADRETVARLGGAPVARLRTRAVLDQVAAWVADGLLNPRVVEVFPLPEAAQALHRVEGGHARGKVVLTNPA
ncbi:zinc-binding dehydrogenase [Paractinoplanes durhamensis]|uniref:zinc-binding dehydrogenase n=1 Tax=Paractinoplanes durhamensis TaxID=113563 RepID=UPI0036293DA3